MIFAMSNKHPWQDRKSWASNSISSDARRAHWVMWGFALFWNLVTLPLLFQFEEIREKIQREPVTAFVFLFPLIGFVLVGMAVAATRQKLHFGLTPLVMDPFPGSLGGQVGGHIDTRIPFDPQQYFSVNLSCIHSRVSKSGKNRNRSESVVWHSEGVCHSDRGNDGTTLRFRFDVPADLPVSEQRSKNYRLWRLRVNAELPGTDFDRSFEIPVFETGAQASGITEATESHSATVDLAMVGVDSVADITSIPEGIEARFPAMQRPAQGIFMLLFGIIFVGVGIGVGATGGLGFLFAGVFGFLGTLIASAGVFYLGKSLLISVSPQGLRSRRFLFGYPIITWQLAAAEFQKIEIKKAGTLRSGKKTTVFYQLFACGPDKKSFPVAERLTSRPEAELLRETYITYLGKDTVG
jgi:hypothetical protein